MVESGTWQNVDAMKRDTMAGRFQDIIDNFKIIIQLILDIDIDVNLWHFAPGNSLCPVLYMQKTCWISLSEAQQTTFNMSPFSLNIHEQVKICEFKPRELELQTDVLCNRVVLTTPHTSVCVQSPWPWRCQSGMKDDLIPCCIIQWETARIAV